MDGPGAEVFSEALAAALEEEDGLAPTLASLPTEEADEETGAAGLAAVDDVEEEELGGDVPAVDEARAAEPDEADPVGI